jgi:uncharacterized membrane protein
MKKKYKTANWKSFGFVSVVSITLFISIFIYYGAFNVYRNDGFTSLFFLLFALASFSPAMWIIHSMSSVYISGDKIIKQSIFRTKTYHISDFKIIYITDTVASSLPYAEIINKDKTKGEKFANLFTIRNIILYREDNFNAMSFKNVKVTLSLPYYQELYETLEKK